MTVNPYVKATSVLLTKIIPTELIIFILYIIPILLMPIKMTRAVVGVSLFLVACLFAVSCMQRLATTFLYEQADHADLQALGGMRVRGYVEAMFSGKGATWPFAKLSASRESIRLQTPFGDFRWDRCDPRLVMRKVATSAWKIGAENAEVPTIVFFSLPWEAKNRLQAERARILTAVLNT